MIFTLLPDKRKLVLTLCILLSAGFAATTLVNYYVSKAAIRKSIVASELPLTSDNLYSQIQKDLIRPILISSMMANDTFLRDWVLGGEHDVKQINKYLREIKQRYGAFTSFFISERTRIYYQTEGVLKKIREDEPRDVWYFRVRKMSAPYEINLDPDLANKDELTIFINYRVYGYDGKYIGIAGIGLTVDAVRTQIDEYQKRYQRSIYFVDKQGHIPVFSAPAGAAQKNINDVEGLRDQTVAILKAGEGTFEYKSGHRIHLVNVRFIPELNWYLFVERIEDDALAGIRSTLYLNLSICVLITVIVLFATSITINRYQRRLEEMATTDKLTGLVNRQAFDLLLPQALLESRREKLQLAAILIDIDHFKDVNDLHGHFAGDSVLRNIAQSIKSMLRESDMVCRWGGEEFLLAVKVSDGAAGLTLADKIRRGIEGKVIHHVNLEMRVTISAGVAIYITGETPEQLVTRADKALYAAKETGRNRVCTAEPGGDAI